MEREIKTEIQTKRKIERSNGKGGSRDKDIESGGDPQRDGDKVKIEMKIDMEISKEIKR